jgi:nucleoside-diphosphate-sugar epimerase
VETGARPTAFVTGADGFLGTELLKVLVARGHEVFGLARSVEAAEQVRRAGGDGNHRRSRDAGAVAGRSVR